MSSSKKDLLEHYHADVMSAITRLIEESPGFTAARCAEHLSARNGFDKEHVLEKIDLLIEHKVLESFENRLYVLTNSMTPVSLEGVRFTPRESLGLVCSDVWRVDENGDLIEVDTDKNTIVSIPRKLWYDRYMENEYETMCSLCIERIVKHSQKQIYPVCPSCYNYIKRKPHIKHRNHIRTVINYLRKIDDEIVIRDLMLFDAVQENVSGCSEALEAAMQEKFEV